MEIKIRIGIMLLGVVGIAGFTAPASATLIMNSDQLITEVVTVQPIIVADDGGGNTANFFGTTSQRSAIEGFIDNIWAQAGIDVNFLNANTWNNTFANWGTGGRPNIGSAARPTSDLNQIVSNGMTAGVTNADPNVLNMFFVRIPAGFSLLGNGFVAGIANVGGNGAMQFVGTNLLSFAGGREAIASVVAHELGHNLGFPHSTEAKNLMQAASSPNQGERMNTAQITTALNSNYSVPVSAIPVPPAVTLFLSGLGVFGWFGRRQRKAITPGFRLPPQAT